MQPNRQWIISALLGLTMLLGACGGSDGTTATAAGGEDGPQSFDDIDYTSPIADFLGIDIGRGEDSEAEYAEIEREAGRLTAECMAELGFDYTPPDRSSFISFSGPGGDIPYFSDEWVDKYGFGITTQRFPQSAVGDLVGFPDESMGPDEDFVDPNDQYVESLSDAEREAYYEALWGPPSEFGPGDEPDENFVYEPVGCQNESYEAAFNESSGLDQQAFFETFSDEIEALYERVESDSRVIEFRQDVSACMADAGLDWDGDMRSLYERFEPRLNDLQPDFGPGAEDPFEAAGLDPENMTDREMEDFFNELNRLDDSQLAVLADLQAEEIALATTAVECGGGPLNEEVLLSEVRIEYEQEFLDNNRAALEEFKAE